MAERYKVELNSAGVVELLKSAEMAAICKGYADGIAMRAGTGYTVSTYTGRTRVNASVRCATDEAWRDNLENNTLIKAVGT